VPSKARKKINKGIELERSQVSSRVCWLMILALLQVCQVELEAGQVLKLLSILSLASFCSTTLFFYAHQNPNSVYLTFSFFKGRIGHRNDIIYYLSFCVWLHLAYYSSGSSIV
jgi:hypothetical protein